MTQGESSMEREVPPSPAGQAAGTSPWTPLYRPAFRAIWIATLVANVGGWMQDMGAAWLMTSLTPSPVLIALVQAAASLPMFFLAVPAGALADIVERRRLLLIGNLFAFAAVSALSYWTLLGRTSPAMLLGLTFAVGLGEALEGPAFQAVVTELVPRSELPTAVSLNSAGYNLARAVGPALGGLVVARAGAGANFLLNALTFLGVLVVLYRWREAPRRSVLPAERFTGAMRAGLRYVAYAPELRAVLVRTGAFIVSGSALWALLPVLVRGFGRGPSAYGVLLGALGVGAVLGAAVLPLLKRRASLDRLVAVGYSCVWRRYARLRLLFTLCSAHRCNACGWTGMDGADLKFQRGGPYGCAVVGAGASSCGVSAGVARGHGSGESWLGRVGRNRGSALGTDLCKRRLAA